MRRRTRIRMIGRWTRKRAASQSKQQQDEETKSLNSSRHHFLLLPHKAISMHCCLENAISHHNHIISHLGARRERRTWDGKDSVKKLVSVLFERKRIFLLSPDFLLHTDCLRVLCSRFYRFAVASLLLSPSTLDRLLVCLLQLLLSIDSVSDYRGRANDEDAGTFCGGVRALFCC